jgi:ubiquitin carboxyl-terminal hydrolase L5
LALLNTVLNLPIAHGPVLSQFKEFTQQFDGELKGLTLTNSTEIRSAHNGFARASAFFSDPDEKDQSGGDGDVYHYTTYIPWNGRVYELDGLHPHPIDHGEFVKNQWCSHVTQILQARLSESASENIMYNLLAITPNPLLAWRKQLEGLDPASEYAQELKRCIADHERLLQQQHRENERRRWNAIPMVMTLLEALVDQPTFKHKFNV